MTSSAPSTTGAPDLPEYAPVPAIAKGAALNEHGYHVWQVDRNLYAVTDNVYMSAFLTTPDGVVIFDAPPNIGHNIRRAVDEITAANGLTNQVTHMVYSHHHADHQGASSLFGGDIVRIGHEETRRLLLRDDDPARPVPDVTFSDSCGRWPSAAGPTTCRRTVTGSTTASARSGGGADRTGATGPR